MSSVWLQRNPLPDPSRSSPPVLPSAVVLRKIEPEHAWTASTLPAATAKVLDSALRPSLGDSTAAEKLAIELSIRDAGFHCPELRSALPLNRDANAWRAHCGESLLYWVEIDDFGRHSVEPDSYHEPGSDRGSRTITIQQEEMEQLRQVR